MADIELGSIVARLKGDTGDFARQMQQATQLLQQVVAGLGQLRTAETATAQTLAQLSAASAAQTQALGQISQANTGTAQSTKQLAAEFGALALAIREQTTAYTQSAAAALAYKQQQDALKEALRQQREEQRAASEATHAAGEIWKTAFSIATGLGIVTSLQGIISTLKQLSVSLVEAGTKFEMLRLSMAALTGSAQAGERTFTTLVTLSNRLGIDVLKTTESFRGFAGAVRGTVLEGERGQRVFEAVTIATRAMGASSSQTQSALLALEQMISKGTVSMEELRRQLGNALPGAFQIAARATGVTTQELEKMVRTGTVEAIPFVEKLGEQLRRELGGGAEAASQSVSASFARLGNELVLLQERIAQSGLLTLLGSLAETAASLISTIRKAQDENQREQGGARVGITPGQAALSPAMQARQQQIDILRNQLSGFMPDLPQLAPAGDRETLQAQVRQLQEEQTKAIAEMQRRLLAEASAGTSGPSPVEEVIDKIVEQIEKGQAALLKLDTGAAMLPGVDIAKQKLTEWNKVLSQIEITLSRLSPELAQTLGPRLGAVLAPANALFAALKAETELAGDAAKEVGEIRHRVEADEKALDAERHERIRQAVKDFDIFGLILDSDQEKNRKQFEQEQRDRIKETVKALDIFGLELDSDQEKNRRKMIEEQRQRIQEFAKSLDIFGLNLSPDQERQRAFDARLQDTLERLRTPREQRVSVGLEAEARRKGVSPDEDLLEQIRIQERLNYTAALFESLANSTAQAWTGALFSIADGTKTVADAFAAMAKSIMQSLAQLAAQEGWKALIRLGVGLIAGAATSGLSSGESPYGSDLGGMTTSPETIGRLTDLQMAIPRAAGGGIFNRPTFAMLGENPATRPEYVLNRQQMDQFIASAGRAGPSAGGQAAGGNAGITIINVSSKEQAEAEAGRERALGKHVVINYVLEEMASGEGSRIMRMNRTMQR